MSSVVRQPSHLGVFMP
jgi:hypothetical protein